MIGRKLLAALEGRGGIDGLAGGGRSDLFENPAGRGEFRARRSANARLRQETTRRERVPAGRQNTLHREARHAGQRGCCMSYETMSSSFLLFSYSLSLLFCIMLSLHFTFLPFLLSPCILFYLNSLDT